MSPARIELLALIAVALAVFLIADHRFGKGRKPKAAQWAKRRDLKPLRVSGPKPGRVVLGRFEGSLIAAEDRASTVVMGPTQLAGKSSRVVIPAILEWDGPVLTTSIKRDTLDATLPRRQELGEVKVFDPLRRTGIPTATWSPVAAAASWTQAREVAAHLMQVGWEQAKHDKDPHWRPAAARHLAPLLLAANAGKQTLADVGRWIDTAERDEPEQLLGRSVDPNAGRAREVLSSLWLKDQIRDTRQVSTRLSRRVSIRGRSRRSRTRRQPRTSPLTGC